MSTLSITVYSQADGSARVCPHGEIDADNAHEIRETVSGLLATANPTAITVDLTGVSFIDSVGIGALVGCHHLAAASEVRLVVVNPTNYVHRLLYVSGLLGLFGAPARPPGQGRHGHEQLPAPELT
jgi:anti-sigma B factor antagonist